ncbi:hypothetical protein RCG67_14670 [Kocuria sp. CPCC 205292]|uniref:hypothetical protein n=1 Tax=Kocuria cellulosilytica TaxID=3071451 RepID=UPI0034D66D62
MVASVAVAGLLFGGASPALADGGKDERGNGHGHSWSKNRNDGEVKVVVKYKKDHGWKSYSKDGVSLKRAASIAKDKCHGGDWWDYYKDARKVDRTGKSDKVCGKRYVRVYFEQDRDWDKGKDDKGKDWGKDDKGKGKDKRDGKH